MPEQRVHTGAGVRLEPLSASHVGDLWQAAIGADRSFDYLRYGPFPTIEALGRLVRERAAWAHQPYWAVLPAASGRAQGWLSYCDIYPADAAIEIGSVWFSPALQRTRAATEAVALLMRHAFDDLGYARLVWRCNADNAASRRAALRHGFVFEGLWRAGAIVKGRTRDVAWHAMLAAEWPAHRRALALWLDAGNFAPDGTARRSLADCRAEAGGPT